ncbi:DUF6635 family protein [Bdellovibrio sp. NC01]|uniref:DUF6635 family protein n=1 Tax=Bdellovibrio sp. NC01 TaxID=2220073 RepID=UPI0011589D8E|nr:DUF6635 family protein [Bdellovibrio sp. NC01]
MKKNEVTVFIDRHFTLNEVVAIQKKSLLADLIFYPLNALWSVPYLAVKKTIETFDKLGWSQANGLIKKVPSAFKTRYQKTTEKILLEDFLKDSQSEIFASLNSKLDLHALFSKAEVEQLNKKVSDLYKEEIDKFSSAQVLTTDLIATLLTLVAGKLFFHNSSLGITGMGSKIARKVANEDAADRFFLGKRMGSTFYNIFPVAPTNTQIYVATFGIGLMLTVLSISVAVFSDPIRKSLGVQDSKLKGLLNSLEQNLYMIFKNEIKAKIVVRKSSKE